MCSPLLQKTLTNLAFFLFSYRCLSPGHCSEIRMHGSVLEGFRGMKLRSQLNVTELGEQHVSRLVPSFEYAMLRETLQSVEGAFNYMFHALKQRSTVHDSCWSNIPHCLEEESSHSYQLEMFSEVS